ncbi:phospholipase D family protein [Comamonas testosteroni]|uniref:Phospholipase D family protein n=1 Tax=Comamonas testosteroni TaxID=285 RepID=A0A373FDX5_COMTE|nr:phospholipase D family protein [Comamonas testosteroni]RGE42340.1 phospholipase D family protein [Comamonas testosteroni]
MQYTRAAHFAFSRWQTAATTVLLASLLAGCGLPPMPPRTDSFSISEQESRQTQLGKALAPYEDIHPGKSGIYFLADAYDAFAARALLARAAQRTLDVQYYIWRNDTTGHLLLDELLNAADRGVRVRLLLDDGGTGGMDTILAALDQHPNLEVRLFNPFAQRTPKAIGYVTDFSRTQRRMHNKSYTVDSAASIVGGRNVGDEYFAATDGVLFADLDVVTTGSVVHDIASGFDRYWNSVSAYPVSAILPPMPERAVEQIYQGLHSDVNRPESQAYVEAVRQSRFSQELLAGTLPLEWAQTTLINDDPAKVLSEVDENELFLSLLAPAVGQPQQVLEVVSPYFVPTQAGVDAFEQMRKQGVRVRILTNSLEATDVAVVHAGYEKYRKPLLKMGVELYEMRREVNLQPQSAAAKVASKLRAEGKREPSSPAALSGSGTGSSGSPGSSGASLHAKTFSVDDKQLFVGSFNFDPRSAKLNTELGVVIEHSGMARQVSETLNEHLPRMAYKVQLDERNRLTWTGQSPQPPHEEQVFSHDPGTSWFKRLLVRVLSWLPIEGLL